MPSNTSHSFCDKSSLERHLVHWSYKGYRLRYRPGKELLEVCKKTAPQMVQSIKKFSSLSLISEDSRTTIRIRCINPKNRNTFEHPLEFAYTVVNRTTARGYPASYGTANRNNHLLSLN